MLTWGYLDRKSAAFLVTGLLQKFHFPDLNIHRNANMYLHTLLKLHFSVLLKHETFPKNEVTQEFLLSGYVNSGQGLDYDRGVQVMRTSTVNLRTPGQTKRLLIFGN
jgi:hypothetical protein